MNIGELLVRIGAIGNSKEVQAFGHAVERAGKALEKYDKDTEKANKSALILRKSGKGVSDIASNLTEDFKTFAGSVSRASVAVLAIVGSLATAYYALGRLTDSLVKDNQQWLNLTRTSNVALSTLQKWGTVGRILGIDGVEQQIAGLEQRLFELKLTGENARGFMLAGIAPTNTEDILEQLRRRVSGLDNTSAGYLLEQMGLDRNLLTLLRLGKEEWEEYLDVQNRFTLNKEQREEIDRLNRQLQIASIQMKYLKDRIVLYLMPAFVRLTKFVASATLGIARFVKWVHDADTPVAKLIKGLTILTSVITGVGVALWAITAHPIVAAITAIIGAIMLLADDFNHYMSGGGSLIGVIKKGLDELSTGNFLDFPIPKWLEYLIRVIDWCEKNKTLTSIMPATVLGGFIKAGIDMSKNPNNSADKTSDAGSNITKGDVVATAVSPTVQSATNDWGDNSYSTFDNRTSYQTNLIEINTSEAFNDLQEQIAYFQMNGLNA